MRQASKALFVAIAGWLTVTGLSALFLFGTGGTFWAASHDPAVASIVWPLFGVIVVAGVTLLFAVHGYVSLLRGDVLAER